MTFKGATSMLNKVEVDSLSNINYGTAMKSLIQRPSNADRAVIRTLAIFLVLSSDQT